MSKQGPRYTRRGLLAAGGAGALALALPVRPGSARLDLGALEALASAHRGFTAPLPIPDVITDAAIQMDIRTASVPILPGRRTKMWTYGGSFPGPTIRRPAGSETQVTFRHRLPSSAGDLSVHLHGGHTPSDDDGQPGGLTGKQARSLYCDISPGLSAKASGNDLLIQPGGNRLYTYPLTEDGGPERAAFQWYHDHRLEHTGRNVWRGLAGMWIIDDDFDAGLPLPRGNRDIPLMIADRSFNQHNQLTNPFGAGGHPPNDGVTGRYVLVNGAYRPHRNVNACRYRLRILNASNFRSYNLALSNGRPMTQIATDSGLMPHPVKRKHILIGPAERVEVIVDFSGSTGKSVRLLSVHRSGRHAAIGTQSYKGALMEFRVGASVPDDTSVPPSLRPLPSWADPEPSGMPQHEWTISISNKFFPTWQINGKTFNPAHVDPPNPVLGTTEIWKVHNRTDVAHLFHIHHTDWYMLSRNGQQPPPWERCLKETFFLDPGDHIVIAGHFSDFLGKYVVHCHMLDHEDHGLMSQFETVSA